MAFIKRSIRQYGGNTTNDFHLGVPEAEGDDIPGYDFESFYEDYLGIENAFMAGRFIITGRKGVGKSAFVRHLMNNQGEAAELYCDIVKGSSITYEKVLQCVPDTYSDRNDLIFEWIVLTKFVNLLLRNKSGESSDGYNSLRRFSDKNSGLANVEQWMVMEETVKDGFCVNYSELIKGFGFAFDKSATRKSMRAPFYSLIVPLRNIVLRMLEYDVYKDLNFILMFDDLDVNFDLNSDEHKKRLVSLIRVARDYNQTFFPHKTSRILIMLRDDISSQLTGVVSDKAKMFNSYLFNLNWYDSDKGVADEQCLLRQFINKRISYCFDKFKLPYDHNDPWRSFVADTPVPAYNNKTAFKFVIDCTFYRPRDLILLFKDIGLKHFYLPLCPNDIKTLLKEYCENNIEEISDELSNTYTSEQIKRIFNVFEHMAQPGLQVSYDDILSFLRSEDLPSTVFDKLVQYNFIVPRDEFERQFFSYRERPRVNKSANYTYRLPKCIYHYYNPTLL